MIYAPREILNHIKEWIPKYNNLFTDETSVNAEIISGSPQVLRVTYNNIYSAGVKVSFIDALIDNGINSVTLLNGILTFTTNKDHDLTIDYNTVNLFNFTDSQFNGEFEIYNIPTKNMFEIELDTLPVLNGNEVLRENWEIGLNDVFEITSATSTSFDIELTGFPEFDIKPIPQLKLIDNYRMKIVSDFKRAEEIYTKQQIDKCWLFLIMEDVSVSKDRNVTGDMNYSNSTGSEQRITNIGRYSIVVVIPTAAELTAQSAVQLCYTDIYDSILKSLSGMIFADDDSTQITNTLIGHGSTVYNRAYYGHAYTFEQVYDYNFENTYTVTGIKSRAFRRINISFAELQDGSYLNLEG